MKKMFIVAVMVLSTITIYAEEMETKEKTDKNKADSETASEKKSPEKSVKTGTVNVAVLNIDNRGSFSDDEIKLFTDRINSEIMQVKRFAVIEREQIGTILKEQGFQQSGACTDRECMLEIGQLLAVQKIIGGSIGKVEDMYPVTLKFIDVQTGKIEAQVVKDFRGNKKKLLSEFIPQITKNLIIEAGYGEKAASKKKKSLLTKPVFWIPVIAVIGGGATAAVLLTKEDDPDGETGVEEMDLSDFPGHQIIIGQ